MAKFNNKPNKCYDVDGQMIWVSRSVAVNGVVLFINANGIFVLAGQRGSGAPDFRGMWNIPSGYLDYDESCPDAAKREIYEECGIDLYELSTTHKVFISHMDQPWHVNSEPSANRQNISLRYGIVYLSDDNDLPSLTSEHCEPNEVSDLKWIDINKISDYVWAFNHDNVIKDYINIIEKVDSFNYDCDCK